MISSNTFTFGGLKVNTHCQVINADGEVMPGLYAAGNSVGGILRELPRDYFGTERAVFRWQAGERAALMTGQ